MADLLELIEEEHIEQVRAKKMYIRTGVHYRFVSRYQRIAPENFYDKSHVIYPSIGFEVSVEAPEEFTVLVKPCSSHVNNIWAYDGLLMPGQAIHVRWYRRPAQELASSSIA